jgi:hypothetical protein
VEPWLNIERPSWSTSWIRSPSGVWSMMMFLESSASSGIDCSAWRSDWAAEAKAASSRWRTASRSAWVDASSTESPLPASLLSPSFGLREEGASSSITSDEPALLEPSLPRAEPPRMPPAPEVVSETLAGAK